MVEVSVTEEARERSRVLTDRANALRAAGKWEEALPICFEAHRADPTSPAAAHNLGVMLTKMGRLAEGEAVLRHALKLAPEVPRVAHALAHNLLGQGRYREAWPLYEARLHMSELNTGFPLNFEFPRWRGESLSGKRLAIFPEQGLGDQIQFSRFLPKLIEQAAAVTLLTLPPLERLFSHNFPAAEIVRAAGNVEFSDPDLWTTLQDIPAALGIALEEVPSAPYLRPPTAWPPLGDGFKIGLKTIGNPNYINDALRSLPEHFAERLRTGLPGRVISLEPKDSGAQDMADTAAIIDQLDMIVSVDTSVAHMAGAMGKPCLLLVPGFGPDWRWMTDRTDSPWYPNHQLYRGEVNGSWAGAVEQLIADAHRIVRTLTARAAVNRAISLRDQGKIDQAFAASEQAISVDPDDPRTVQTHGVLLSSLGRISEGEALLRDFLSRHPDHAESRYALALNLLSQGRYREAWPYHEAREQAGFGSDIPRGLPFPRWQGEDLKGKHIAIFPEQGFGDEIQFVRFVPELVRRGAQVTLLTRPALVRLFAQSLPGIDIVPAIGATEFPDPDYWATLIDLPARLGLTIETIPSEPYLRWPEIRETPGERPKIGIKLAGNPRHRNDAWRTLGPELVGQLRGRLPGTVVSLEPEATRARDFADTAAIIAGLDLVVSVDTSVGHLAGAMGKPCLLLVSGFDPDWRWMRDRGDSPWYPGHRLFRSTADGDWSAAIDQLLEAVEPCLRREAAERLMLEARAQRAAGQPRKALAAVEQAVATDPSSVGAAYMYAVFLGSFGKLTESEAILRRVIQTAPHLPNPRDALGVNLLAQGRYHEGWPLYEARTEREGLNDGFPRNFPYPRWQGENLKGKRIAIFPEQGFGDQIQFVRFIPRLQRQGAKVTLLASPPLFELFKRSFPDVEVVAASGSVDFPDPDYWATLADLPVRLDVQPDKLWEDPYLRAPESAAEWTGEDFRIGFMAQGNPAFANDRYRSLPPDLAVRLQNELAGTVIDLSPEKTGARDFAQTAAIIATLDLVVSVDTAVAHLAGAMGKSCLLMIPGYATDWRWMRERRDSPWYPNHVLYRSDIDAGWNSAVQAVIQDVRNVSKSPLRYIGLASRYRARGRYSEALAAGRKALTIDPKNPNALHNLARLLADLGRIREAEALQRKAIAVSQGDIYRYGLGLNLLSQGRYSEGWPFYEARTRITSLRAGFPQGVKFPRWMGEDISDKRIAVFPEQGFGDQLQFARFLPQLRERCGEIVLLTPPALVRLFELAFPDTTVVKASGAADFPRCSVWTTLVELGRILEVRLDNLPDPQFLSLDARRPPEAPFRIGFMGKGNPGYIHDAHRTLPQEAAQRLRAALPGEVIDLDPAVSGARDFLDTARIMADLDLIVSVDTAVGHLAGVIGKPCCLLVPGFATDWRWLHGRSDSPWYPKHILFRGSVEGNWDEAIDGLVALAREMADQAAALPSSA
jgi:ADP-heptose:LPS heptosyltransferase